MSIESSLTFRARSFDADEAIFALWLRLMALNLDGGSISEMIALRNEWLDLSADANFCFLNLDNIDGQIKHIELVLMAAAKVVELINDSGTMLQANSLNLLGIRGLCWGATVNNASILVVGEQFVRLICQHSDIVEQIIARHTCNQPRLGPPCPYCRIRLFHPKGQQCLECGWDWHDLKNPIQRKTGPGRKVFRVACLEDGGNPFDYYGCLRRTKQDSSH